MNRKRQLVGAFAGLTIVATLLALTAFAQTPDRERGRGDAPRRGEEQQRPEAGRPDAPAGRQFPGGRPDFPGGPGGPGGGGFGGPGPGGGRPFPGGPMGGTAIAATQQYVFVVQGNQLFQFRVDGLQLVKRVELEGPRPPMGPGGGGGFRPGESGTPPRPEGDRPERGRRPEGGRERDQPR